MTIHITPSGQACGATVHDVDLRRPLSRDVVAAIRRAWLQHHVLCFPNQDLNDDDLERFSLSFGPFGSDPYIAPIPGREHVIALSRRAEEKAPIFAESWHTDWSFQQTPPAATCLYGIEIPPAGGDTLFANQQRALADMPADLRQKIEGKQAIHSARAGYAPDGLYGDKDKASDRSMTIVPSSEAMATQSHALIRRHPESGCLALFGCFGYVIGVEGMAEAEGQALLREVYQWQTRPEFQYRQRWQAQTLVMWDNRSVLHRATGGYEGHHRLLHRTTIADNAAYYRQ